MTPLYHFFIAFVVVRGVAVVVAAGYVSIGVRVFLLFLWLLLVSILSFFVVIVMGAFASVVAVIAFVMDGYSNARVTPIKFQQKHGLTEEGGTGQGNDRTWVR